jgi:hypothetical protein
MSKTKIQMSNQAQNPEIKKGAPPESKARPEYHRFWDSGIWISFGILSFGI